MTGIFCKGKQDGVSKGFARGWGGGMGGCGGNGGGEGGWLRATPPFLPRVISKALVAPSFDLDHSSSSLFPSHHPIHLSKNPRPDQTGPYVCISVCMKQTNQTFNEKQPPTCNISFLTFGTSAKNCKANIAPTTPKLPSVIPLFIPTRFRQQCDRSGRSCRYGDSRGGRE